MPKQNESRTVPALTWVSVKDRRRKTDSLSRGCEIVPLTRRRYRPTPVAALCKQISRRCDDSVEERERREAKKLLVTRTVQSSLDDFLGPTNKKLTLKRCRKKFEQKAREVLLPSMETMQEVVTGEMRAERPVDVTPSAAEARVDETSASLSELPTNSQESVVTESAVSIVTDSQRRRQEEHLMTELSDSEEGRPISPVIPWKPRRDNLRGSPASEEPAGFSLGSHDLMSTEEMRGKALL